MGPEWIVAGVVLLVVLLVVMTGRNSRRGRGSTAGHYDPDAIGGYTLDPATMRYRYDLPTLPRSSGSVPFGDGPPHRRRRHGTRPPGTAGG
jgi:hypothetical protein